MNTYPSRLFEQAVHELSRLPGIGRKTAMRLVLHLLKQDAANVEALGNSLVKLRNEVKYCHKCFNISDREECDICANHKREQHLICVVEDIRDVIAVENTRQFNGTYHILNGLISPMDGIRPEDLNIESLIGRICNDGIREVIFALPATIEGDTTSFYIFRKLEDRDVRVSVIARGISFGDDLEYADEITLGRSIVNRTPYQSTLVK
jgi:recombination protein RecR